VQHHKPDCVVLDLRMPQMSGFDVQAALQQTHAELPVVVITGDDVPEGRARALRQGARAYLRKPVDDATLLDAIEAAIGEKPALA
jgi:FixJ family two-component response regulator